LRRGVARFWGALGWRLGGSVSYSYAKARSLFRDLRIERMFVGRKGKWQTGMISGPLVKDLRSMAGSRPKSFRGSKDWMTELNESEAAPSPYIWRREGTASEVLSGRKAVQDGPKVFPMDWC